MLGPQTQHKGTVYGDDENFFFFFFSSSSAGSVARVTFLLYPLSLTHAERAKRGTSTPCHAWRTTAANGAHFLWT